MNAGWLQGKENVKLEMRSPRFHAKGSWILAMTLGKTNDACPKLLIRFLCKFDKSICKSPLKM